jgi:hypothetical protein
MFPEGHAAVAKAPHLARAFAELSRRDSFVKVHDGLFKA